MAHLFGISYNGGYVVAHLFSITYYCGYVVRIYLVSLITAGML